MEAPTTLAGAFSRTQKTNTVYTAKAAAFSRTSPTRPPLDIVKSVLDTLGVPSDYVTYSIWVYNTTGQLISVITDAIQGSFTDLVNGGSGSGSFQVPRNFIDVGWIDYNYRVQFFLSDSIDPWYDGFVVEFDQSQDDDDYDHDSITVQTDGWSSFMSRAIVTETLSPGVQSNGVDNGVEYADEYLIHLVTTYLDSEHFQASFIASMPIGLDEISFDGTGLDQCVDTVVKQVLNETGNLFEWWVRGPRIGLPKLVIQPQQDPALQTTAYYSPDRQRACVYYPEFKNSTMYDYQIQNSIADLANQIALYGGQDPTTGLTVYGPFKDSTSISLYGLCQKQVTDTSLISTASLANYATAYLIMNGYPQPQGTYKKFAPTDQMRSGQWIQIMEPGVQDTGETFILGTNEISNAHPGNIKQVRCIQVVTSWGQSEDGDRIEQEVTFTAPRPYIDQAYYAAIGAAATTQQSQQAQASNQTKVSTTYLQSGLDYVSNTPASGSTPASVTVTPPTGVFYGGSETTEISGGNITLPLQDSSSSATGDGTYHIVFAQNQNESFGTGPSGPGLQVVKGPLPPAYSTTVLPGWRFTVQGGAVVGNKDQRVQGGVGTNNYKPASIPASALQAGALTDLAVTSLNAETGAVVLTSSDDSVTITASGETIDLKVAGGADGVTSIEGLTGVVTIDSPDSSVEITTGTGVIHLEAHGGVEALNGLTGDITIESADGSLAVTASGTDINIENNGVKSLQGATGAVTLESTDSSVTITESGGIINLKASPTAGVAELNGLSGDLTIESTDDSLTVTASGTSINIESNGVKSVNGNTGALTIDSPDSSIAVTNSGSDIHLEAGVKSVQGATGAVTFNSPDSSVTISESGGVIHLEASGGGGGGPIVGGGGAVTVVQQAINKSQSSGSSVTTTLLSPATAGNTIICAIACDPAATYTPTTGFTSLGVISAPTSGYGEQGFINIYTKTAIGGETSFEFTVGGLSNYFISLWVGEVVNATTLTLGSSVNAGSAPGTSPVPITASLPINSLALAFFCTSSETISDVSSPSLDTDVSATMPYNSLLVGTKAVSGAETLTTSFAYGTATDGSTDSGAVGAILVCSSAGDGVLSIAGQSGPVTVGSSDNSVQITAGDGHIDLSTAVVAKIVQRTAWTGTEPTSVSFTHAPTPGNLLVLLTSAFSSAFPANAPGFTTAVYQVNGPEAVRIETRVAESGDTATFDLSSFGSSSGYCMLFEIENGNVDTIQTIGANLVASGTVTDVPGPGPVTPTSSSGVAITIYSAEVLTSTGAAAGWTDYGASPATGNHLGVAHGIQFSGLTSIQDSYSGTVSGGENPAAAMIVINSPSDYPSLEDLSDVDASSKSTGQVLTWSGSKWVPATPSGGGGGGGGSDIPFVPVQENVYANQTNATSITVPFNFPTTSGNTLLVILSGSTTGPTTPSGWTRVLYDASATYTVVAVYMKSADGTETGFTTTYSSPDNLAAYFMELPGARNFDSGATAVVSGQPISVCPTIAPSVGSMVFGMASFISSGGGGTNMGPTMFSTSASTYRPLHVSSLATSRSLGLVVRTSGFPGGTFYAPTIGMNDTVYSSSNSSFASFSIK